MEILQEKEKELLSFLQSIGFKGEALEENIHKNISLGIPGFSINHKIRYGGETMFYDLHFKKDHQFDAYRLEQYKATHRDAVIIKHQQINGIDTAELEERMKGRDWDTYFKSPEKIASDETKSLINETIIQLNKLSEGQNFDGIKIQEELMFKYWPVEAYGTSVADDFKHLYEHNRKFNATEFGICNAHLAYYIVSGKLDTLHEQLNTMRLDQYPGMELYSTLERILSTNPEQFTIECSRNTPEGYIEFKVPVYKEDGGFKLESYQATYTPYPAIKHGTYNGIDTRELEAMMDAIDWHNDSELFIFNGEDIPEFQPKVGDIPEQLYRLSQDFVGADIAVELKLRYWPGATFFEDILNQEAWDALDSLPKIQQEFPCEIEAQVAYNLMCGRAVMEHEIYSVLPEHSDWVRLDLNDKDEDGVYPLILVGSLSKEELTALLEMIPLANRHYQDIPSLIKGDCYEARLANGNKVLLEVNPEQKTIDVFTTSKNTIPINIHFDPHWQPNPDMLTTVKQIEVSTKRTSEAAGNFYQKKNKGRRI